jgi:2',3'-cyclic-nucleotide 2'-phosphodiesterase (5'-nucleotidase family)
MSRDPVEEVAVEILSRAARGKQLAVLLEQITRAWRGAAGVVPCVCAAIASTALPSDMPGRIRRGIPRSDVTEGRAASVL